MTYTTIVTQNPNDPWTSSKFNSYVKGNIEHLAGMKLNGTALSALTGGSELATSLIDDDNLGGVTGITISSIPQIYLNLKLVIVAKSASGSEDAVAVRVGYNTVDSAVTLYSRSGINLINTTITGASDEATAANILLNCSINSTAGAASRYSTTIIQFPLYSQSLYKSAHWSHRANISASAAGQKWATGGTNWNSASVINVITISTVSGSNFATDSHYYLFGEL